MAERIQIADDGTLAIGEAFFCADDAGAVHRHVADGLCPQRLAHGVPAMVRTGDLLILAERCFADGLACAAHEEAFALDMAARYRDAMQKHEARAACARLSRASIEATRKAG